MNLRRLTLERLEDRRLLSLAPFPALIDPVDLPDGPVYDSPLPAVGSGDLPAAKDGDWYASPRGPEFLVNSYTADHQNGPVVAMDASGNFVVAWNSNGQDGDGYDVFAQRYDAAGEPQGPEFQVNTFTTLGQDSPAVAMDASGSFVIAWRSASQDGDSGGIYAQRYNAAGEPQGGEFQVNSYVAGSQDSPAVAMSASGDFVIVWASSGQDASGYGVYAQRYHAAGEAQGPEFQVNTHTPNDQRSPAVAADACGNLVIGTCQRV